MNVAPDGRTQVVHGHDVVRPGDGHYGRAVLPADGECMVATGGLLGKQGRGCGIERVPVEVHIFEPDLFCQGTRLGHLRLGR